MSCPRTTARTLLGALEFSGRSLVAALIVVALLGLPACGAKRRNQRDDDRSFLTAEALYDRAIEELAEGDLGKSREFLERIQLVDPASTRRMEPLVRLALADATFYEGDDLSLIEARSKYEDFVTLYSDHARAPYAQLQAGVCSLLQVRHPTRDQTLTFEALKDLRGVIRRYPASPYSGAARDMIALAETNLASHELAVGRFYFKKKAWTASTNRLKRILDRYPRYRDREDLFLLLGQSLLKNENDIEGRIYLERLITEYPHGSNAKKARAILSNSVADGVPQAADGQEPMGTQP